tara:strand:- start:363 stop:893 length:531 start_codon:yes stop_codon:yes gene_type:complete
MGVQTALLIASGVGAISSLAQAAAASSAISRDIEKYKEEKKYAELRALQDENNRRDIMEETLSNNRAIAGAAGILDDSRSFLTIQDDVRENAKKDIANIRLNLKIAGSKYDQAISNAKIEKQSVAYNAIADVSSYAMNGWNYYNYYKGPPKTTTQGIGPGESLARFGNVLGAGLQR